MAFWSAPKIRILHSVVFSLESWACQSRDHPSGSLVHLKPSQGGRNNYPLNRIIYLPFWEAFPLLQSFAELTASNGCLLTFFFGCSESVTFKFFFFGIVLLPFGYLPRLGHFLHTPLSHAFLGGSTPLCRSCLLFSVTYAACFLEGLPCFLFSILLLLATAEIFG